jgi:hypothetical protein
LLAPNPSENPRSTPQGGLIKRVVPFFSAKPDSIAISSSESAIVVKFSLIRAGLTDFGITTTPRATINYKHIIGEATLPGNQDLTNAGIVSIGDLFDFWVREKGRTDTSERGVCLHDNSVFVAIL